MTGRQLLVLSIYGALLLLCVALFVIADLVGPAVREAMRPVAVEGFRTVLTALVGALSVLLATK